MTTVVGITAEDLGRRVHERRGMVPHGRHLEAHGIHCGRVMRIEIEFESRSKWEIVGGNLLSQFDVETEDGELYTLGWAEIGRTGRRISMSSEQPRSQREKKGG